MAKPKPLLDSGRNLGVGLGRPVEEDWYNATTDIIQRCIPRSVQLMTRRVVGVTYESGEDLVRRHSSEFAGLADFVARERAEMLGLSIVSSLCEVNPGFARTATKILEVTDPQVLYSLGSGSKGLKSRGGSKGTFSVRFPDHCAGRQGLIQCEKASLRRAERLPAASGTTASDTPASQRVTLGTVPFPERAITEGMVDEINAQITQQFTLLPVGPIRLVD